MCNALYYSIREKEGSLLCLLTDFGGSWLCCGSRTRLTLGGDVRQGKSDRPTSIRLLNLSIYMYIHIHELLDHALLAMHLALLEKLNLSPPPWQLTEKDCSAQVTKDWQGLVLNHCIDVGNESRISSLDL